MTGAVLIHASCVAIEGLGVLIAGPSGSGKSDLALRLIDRGARLVSDDYTELLPEGAHLRASPPPAIAGMIEVRGIGIVPMAHDASVAVALLVDLAAPVERLPEEAATILAGVEIPTVALAALEPSAPIKVEIALNRLGLKLQ